MTPRRWSPWGTGELLRLGLHTVWYVGSNWQGRKGYWAMLHHYGRPIRRLGPHKTHENAKRRVEETFAKDHPAHTLHRLRRQRDALTRRIERLEARARR